MTAIILAAGYATRLHPLTENFPKPLLEVGGSTILDRLLDGAELGRVVVVTNHKFAQIFEEWSNGRYEIVDDGTENNDTRLGAVRDIQYALTTLGISDDIFVAAGDNVLDFQIQEFISFAKSTGTSCVMAHKEERLEALQKTAVITVDGEGKITSYEEKPKEPKGNLAVPPFYYYRAQDVQRIPEALATGCSPDAPGSFASWLSRVVPMHAWKMTGKRYDIGDLASYEAVKRIFKE